MWHQGWKAVVRHTTGENWDDDRWELYHLDADYAELHDLADAEPARLRALIERWWAEAGANGALPLDDRGSPRTLTGGRPNPRTVFTFLPSMARIERWSTPNVANRSFSIAAEVEIPLTGAEGVLLAAGNRFGGYTLFVQDSRLHFEYNAGHTRHRIGSDTMIPAGQHTLGLDFVRTGHLQGWATLLLDGQPIGSGGLTRTWPINPARGSLTCGRDGGSPVSDAYSCPFRFTGRLAHVTVSLGDDQRRDPSAERRAALKED
jgi:arylsulfatase